MGSSLVEDSGPIARVRVCCSTKICAWGRLPLRLRSKEVSNLRIFLQQKKKTRHSVFMLSLSSNPSQACCWCQVNARHLFWGAVPLRGEAVRIYKAPLVTSVHSKPEYWHCLAFPQGCQTVYGHLKRQRTSSSRWISCRQNRPFGPRSPYYQTSIYTNTISFSPPPPHVPSTPLRFYHSSTHQITQPPVWDVKRSWNTRGKWRSQGNRTNSTYATIGQTAPEPGLLELRGVAALTALLSRV